jgi:hypothetical protein
MGEVAPGSAEDELGRSLAGVLLGPEASARDAYAVARTGPRFSEMLGGPEGAKRAYADMAANLRGMSFQSLNSGPNGSVIIVFAGQNGQQVKLHVLRGAPLPDGKLRVGGFALIP